MSYTLHLGDSRNVLKTFAEASVDSIVCDPPYELGFMGKGWDSTGVANDPTLWRECLRVLKPGGHLLAFSGTRTYHRMTCAIEDAGFEVRDQIGWLYGSGFPKSMNVDKAIAAKLTAGAGPGPKRPEDFSRELTDSEALFCAWMRDHSGLPQELVKAVTGSARFMTGKVEVTNTSTAAAPRYGRRAMVPTSAAWAKLTPHMREQPPEWVEALVKNPPQDPDETPGEAWTKGRGVGTQGDGSWAGWGTALKPAWEPIVMARRPLRGTVAENVLAHGTGAVNVDGCRVPSGADHAEKCASVVGLNSNLNGAAYGEWTDERTDRFSPLGRWPANVIHDGSDEVTRYFPDEDGIGSAARFFYCAKASTDDRNDGTKNRHPTVKPTDLMRYLCRLVTPKGGIVLDPFMGSGSTGKAAMLEGFAFVGIDMTPEYVEIARARIDFAKRQGHQPELL